MILIPYREAVLIKQIINAEPMNIFSKDSYKTIHNAKKIRKKIGGSNYIEEIETGLLRYVF